MRVLIPIVVLSMALMAAVVGRHRSSKKSGVPSGIFVLFTRVDPPMLQTRCPEGQCAYLELENFSCPEDMSPPAEVLIVSGHSVPPQYLSAPPQAIARVVQCLRPRMVVLDTCYGFSSPLLEELASIQPPMLVIGATYKLPPAGLVYEEAFYTAQPAPERAQHIRTRSGAGLERWWTDRDALRRTLAEVATWESPRLTANLQRKHPNLVRVPLHGSEATLLAPVAPERFRP
ncbi:MAG TPA: hypothetical protein VF815_18775 [Myxococcaceae bacterium]|jgi:hypothetical protein